jgi:pimeloyl-ACP methyl ester carboxylesterase
MIQAGTYTRLGSGSPLFFINGIYQRRQSWEPITAGLSKSFECITFDFPNQNLADHPENINYAFDKPALYEDHVLELIETLGFTSNEVTGCGLSFGSNLLRNLHLRRNVDFKELVLIGMGSTELLSWMTQFTKSFTDLCDARDLERFAEMFTLWAYSHKWVGDNPIGVEMIKRRFVDLFSGNECIHALHRSVKEDNKLGIPEGRFRCPTTLMNGEEDIICPPHSVSRYARECGAAFCMLDGAGHAFPVEEPERALLALSKVLL